MELTAGSRSCRKRWSDHDSATLEEVKGLAHLEKLDGSVSGDEILPCGEQHLYLLDVGVDSSIVVLVSRARDGESQENRCRFLHGH